MRYRQIVTATNDPLFELSSCEHLRQIAASAGLALVLVSGMTSGGAADQFDFIWVSDRLPPANGDDISYFDDNNVTHQPPCRCGPPEQPDLGQPADTSYDAIQTSFLQQPQGIPTQSQATLTATPYAGAAQLPATPFGQLGPTRSLDTSAVFAPGVFAEFVFNPESQVRVSTDVGNLLGKSPSVPSVGVQNRSRIITEPRIRGSRVSAMAAAGSHWVPARIDLDTMLSKIDSRIVLETVVIKGPYTAIYGPGLKFVDVTLLPAPRYGERCENHGSTSFDYKSNGENWYGRQSVWGGQSDWGYRVSYGHRTGNDYESGNGVQIPSSFKSRDWEVALGADLTGYDSVDFHYLRLDQTDVELPGQAFDINWLVTDGYEVIYRNDRARFFDQFELRSWYNRTRFEGDNRRAGKRAMFPVFDFLRFFADTDVDSMSTGYRALGSWETGTGTKLIAGADLRYIKQELNELASGIESANANSPIPRSHSSNPGLILELSSPKDNPLRVRVGGRLDWVSMNIEDDAAKLAAVTPQDIPYADVVGSDQFDQNNTLALTYFSAEYRLNPCSTMGLSFGFAERPPNLTERYAAEPFMFLLQNGLNTVTGDPTLDPERLWQLDLQYQFETPRFRTGVNGFFAWAHDYITFENLSVKLGPPDNDPVQVNLKYVNTSFATLAGVEWYGELDLTPRITPFATAKYVQGTDHTRNGDFDTIPAERMGMVVTPSSRDYNLPRGSDALAGLILTPSEPLPGILPLEARVGVRVHPLRRPQRRQNRARYRTETQHMYDELEPAAEQLPERHYEDVYAASWETDMRAEAIPPHRRYRPRAASRNGRGDRLASYVPQQDRWGIEFSARIVDNQNRVANSLLESSTPGFTVWDVRTFWRPRRNVFLVAGVENLTDKNYREHLDFRSLDGVISVFQPGLNIYFGGELTY